MALPASAHTREKANKKDPVTKERKGFLWGLFSRSPKVPLKTVKRRPSAPVLSHTLRDLPRQNLLLSRPSTLSSTQDPQSKTTPKTIPFCKGHLRELGITTPVVVTQPRVAGSETVLPSVDKAIFPQDMLFSRMRSASRKTSPTSSRSRPVPSRGALRPTSDYIVNNEQPVWDITYGCEQFAPLSSSTISLPGLSDAHASRTAVREKLGELPLPPVRHTVPISSLDGETSSPPIPPLLSGSSTSRSIHRRSLSSSCAREHQIPPSIDDGRVSVASQRSQRFAHVEPASLFPVDEGLFGRPKPPPPLKIIPKKAKQHRRKDTAPPSFLPINSNHKPDPGRITSHTRSQTEHQTSIRQTLTNEPSEYLYVSGGSSFSDSVRTPCNEHSLSRISTHVALGSDQALASSTPKTKWTWAPPASWSGPSSATESEDSVPSIKKPAFAVKPILRRTKSSSRVVASAAKLFYSQPDASTTALDHFVTPPDGNGSSLPMREKRESRRVIVRMQGFPGGDFKEAPLHDVIPRLRELKSSVLED